MPNPNGNPQNLKPFKKGEDKRRNIAGGPKKLPDITNLLIELLNEQGQDGKSKAQAIFDGLAERAAKGDTKAAELILNRAYGKPKDNEGQPTEMIIRVQRNS